MLFAAQQGTAAIAVDPSSQSEKKSRVKRSEASPVVTGPLLGPVLPETDSLQGKHLNPML